MAKYFGIYANANERNSAVTSSAITRPYVALVGGGVDYNSYWDGKYYAMIMDYEGEWHRYDFGEIEDGNQQIVPYLSISNLESGETGSGVYYGLEWDFQVAISIYKSNGRLVSNVNVNVEWAYNCTDDPEFCDNCTCDGYAYAENYTFSEFWLDDGSFIGVMPDPYVAIGGNALTIQMGSFDETDTWYLHYNFNVDCHENLPCQSEQTMCENAGGTWVDDGVSTYCDCGCNNEEDDYQDCECSCVMSGGEWVDDGEGNFYCQYPEAEPGDPGE